MKICENLDCRDAMWLKGHVWALLLGGGISHMERRIMLVLLGYAAGLEPRRVDKVDCWCE